MLSILRKLPKSFIFVIFGSVAGILGATCGEIFFQLTTPNLSNTSNIDEARAVCLLIDCSGSMEGQKLAEVKKSAEDFAARQDLNKHEIAVIGFESTVNTVCPLTHELKRISAGVQQLASNGSTGMALGLDQAGTILQNSSLEKVILLFTDGKPDSNTAALREGMQLRNNGIGIVAVATTDADQTFLSQLTGSPSRVITTRIGSIDEAFQKAEEMISRGLIARSTVTSSTAIVQTAGWSILLAINIASFLAIAQNVYLRRKVATVRGLCFTVLAGSLAGIIAGIIGQYVYSNVSLLRYGSLWAIFGLFFSCLGLMLWRLGRRKSGRKRIITWRWSVLYVLVIVGIAWFLSRIILFSAVIQDTLSRTIGLAILGSIVGLGLALFIPNMGKVKGLIGGLLGGVAAGLLFAWISRVWSDAGARIIGAVILGACIGYAIALIESVWREAYLEVEWGPNEKSVINLGNKEILLGSGQNCHVYIRDYPAVSATVTLKSGNIVFEDKTTGKRQTLQDGNKLKIGKLIIYIHAHQ